MVQGIHSTSIGAMVTSMSSGLLSGADAIVRDFTKPSLASRSNSAHSSAQIDNAKVTTVASSFDDEALFCKPLEDFDVLEDFEVLEDFAVLGDFEVLDDFEFFNDSRLFNESKSKSKSESELTLELELDELFDDLELFDDDELELELEIDNDAELDSELESELFDDELELSDDFFELFKRRAGTVLASTPPLSRRASAVAKI